MNISDFKLTKAKSAQFITAVNAVLSGADVSAIDRTRATELALAELIAKACPLPSADQSCSQHFRAVILPQVNALLSCVVEVMRIDIEQTVKTTFNIYQHHFNLMCNEDPTMCRPDVEEYIKDLDVGHAKIVREYPTLPRMYWALKDVFVEKKSGGVDYLR